MNSKKKTKAAQKKEAAEVERALKAAGVSSAAATTVLDALKSLWGNGKRKDVPPLTVLEEVCSHAVRCYGLLAPEVLAQHGIREGKDVGVVIAALARVGCCALTEKDDLSAIDVGPLRNGLRARALESVAVV